jgi:hypothetical protein
MNYELNELTENADIVGFIESKGIAWLGHVMRMDDKRTPKRILQWKPTRTRTTGRPRKRWIVDIEDVQIMGKNGESTVKKEQNGRESMRRLKPVVGCNVSKRRRRRKRRRRSGMEKNKEEKGRRRSRRIRRRGGE